ncbi:diacylglycerol kinase [Ectothiorhodospiraceae bacterium 2226]|nr:diacylglycerol kinase [Ectothiorhodospiraceae bacterium 2226]
MRKPPHELRRLANATRYSWQGLRAAFRHERAFRLEVVAAAVLLPLAVWLGEGPLERALLVAVVLLVMVAELLNSAVEATVNRIGTEHHPLAGRAKDLGSAAVFVSVVLAGAVWLLILL